MYATGPACEQMRLPGMSETNVYKSRPGGLRGDLREGRYDRDSG